MNRLLVLSWLLALKIVITTCDDEQVLSQGAIMRLRAPNSPENVDQCFVTSSQGKKYELFPYNESPGTFDGDKRSCSIEARDIGINYAGLWTMETITANKSLKTNFVIKMKQEKVVRPADYISAAEGQWTTLWLDSKRENLTYCNLTHHQYETYNLMEDKFDDLIRTTSGCGVRMLVSNKMVGQWSFYAQFGDYLMESAMFQISIPWMQKDNKILHETWELGRPAKLKGLGHFCKVTKPDGTVLPLIFGSCVYEIPAVSADDSGVWKIAYARTDKVELDQMQINVTTIDGNFLESSATLEGGNKINLMCKTALKYIRFCLFIRPDGNMINAAAGLGNDKYSYHGQGYNKANLSNNNYGECGLTIHNPSKEDFGLWNCYMAEGRGAVINVAKTTRVAKQVRRIDSPNVFVKRGDDFKIRCTINAELDYCWLTSPNGTVYSISTEENVATNLKYDGKGFFMGDCGAIIKKAEDTDNGDWICHLGIRNGAEVEATVAVKVSDAYLIAVEDTVYSEPKTKLSCRTFLDEKATLRYCRWIRPNGHGINKEENSRYYWQHGKTECSLTILTPEPEDIGQWQCVALLSLASSNEERASILMKAVENEEKIMSSLSIILGIGVIVIVTCFVVFYIYKIKKIRMSKSPPSYCSEDYTIPQSMQTPNSTIQTKY